MTQLLMHKIKKKQFEKLNQEYIQQTYQVNYSFHPVTQSFEEINEYLKEKENNIKNSKNEINKVTSKIPLKNDNKSRQEQSGRSKTPINHTPKLIEQRSKTPIPVKTNKNLTLKIVDVLY